MRFASKRQTVASIDETEGVELIITEPEDLWHANNLIAIGDVVYAPTLRKVTTEGATGSTSAQKVRTELAVNVSKTSFDPRVSELRVAGTIVNENPIAAVGQYHTLTLKHSDRDIKFTIWKRQGWDSVALALLTEAVSETANKDVVFAVVMQEGVANLCLITESRTVVKQRIEHTIPKKRSTRKETEGGMSDFYGKVLAAILAAIDFNERSGTPKQLLLASPGFVAQNFRAYMKEYADKHGDKPLARLAKEAAVVHTSTGHVHSLNEVLKSPEAQRTMRDAKFTNETSLMDNFYQKLRQDDGRAWYGVNPVAKAIREGAVGRGGGVLMVNSAFFRSMDVAERQKYVALVDKVSEDGGDVRLLSSDHESGQRLDALGGIAALLTYPLHDLDEDDDEEDVVQAEGSAAGTTII
ncbi:hypothetical protein QBC40DRAFT_179673 [Triangularia verruculosa]|uniref:Protein DOM34 homolog n=1 Tax=Triangularia verruculosa TaxID=2587418 RepID=A0AAN6XC56_9PEZI|nr:hypothetical protein QBC40DRAFT_179673 [Triangularia verruculosa]